MMQDLAPMITDLQEQTAERGAANYRQGLRAAVRGLWSGALDSIDAGAAFDTTIRRGFTRAYHDGAKTVGVLPSEMTPTERLALQTSIQREFSFVDRFLTDIENNSKAQRGKLAPLFSRVELWVQRYQQVYTDGQMTAKGDPKLKWIVTAAESCNDCIRLANKVKRKSQWEAAGLQPQVAILD